MVNKIKKESTINKLGWLNGITWKPSPNFDNRPVKNDISLIVLHCISLPPRNFGGAYIESFFRNKLDVNLHPYFEKIIDIKVSSHFLIDRMGQVSQFVSCDKRAWHAGNSMYNERKNCNDFSIGIELEGHPDCAYTTDQYYNLSLLVYVIKKKYNIDCVRSHSNVAVPKGRKVDPGKLFNWTKYKNMKIWDLVEDLLFKKILFSHY